jgi:hypothetical protein
MPTFTHILFHEMSLIDKIIRDETWLEGERRGGPVSSTDPVVRRNVCCAIIRAGYELREATMQRFARGLIGEIGLDPEAALSRAA